ncbi:MAG: hypothetical protein UR68_C0028G0005 [Candidatus Roizmanbacteria bacterium GW2011_GWA2_35_19]|uniref:Uncharacterized protein n=2 Tax=Candidatus Roizmaniibacteriota TaxID=1752723 RepID=A0A0G0BQN2_9BACT|nr:MAG: hypothetical protein UR63_C0010G0003 [Candidatus Roizmanbacteria bacterium GW2011_GWC2_35_12]KKP71688.1 MAG: hypothetical protein UR68_C0028G0005 [Candidatus Roizmanbacteria bacterium GW2011_GWA2_35_19]
MKFFLIGLLIISAFIGGYFFSQKYNFKIENKNTSVTTPTVAPTQPVNLVGDDSDEHGCKGSAGYSWCEAKQKCLRAWEEPCLSNEEEIKQVIIDKHGWEEDEVNITFSKTTDEFARGGIKEVNAVSGGMFLARKNSGKWEIVFEGNGAPDCNLLKTTYLFPTGFLTGICD